MTVHDTTSATFYPTYDGNGNVSEYVNQSGTKAAHFEYDPFGNLTVDSEGNAEDFPYRFSTKPQDLTTGLYYYGYRYYDPLTGRWPSRDPIEERGGINLYAFVGNDGINKWDLLGMLSLTVTPGNEEELECGGYNYKRHWWTGGDLKKSKGYLIQNVSITVVKIEKCDGSRISLSSDNYSEYWGPITQDGNGYHRLPAGKQKPYDMIEFPALPGTCGEIRFDLSAAFYALSKPPSGYSVRNRPPAWDLPYSDSLYQGSGGSNNVTATITIKWNCCKGSKRTESSRTGV